MTKPKLIKEEIYTTLLGIHYANTYESVPDMALVYDEIDVNEASSDFFRIFFNGIAT